MPSIPASVSASLLAAGAMAPDQFGNALAAKRFQNRPNRKATGAPGKLGSEMRGIAAIAGRFAQVAGRDIHGAAMRMNVADNREPGIVRNLQPLVTIGRPTVGAIQPGRPVLQLGHGARPKAKGTIHMQPGVVFRGQIGQTIKVIEGAPS